jgi:Xaa-Pro aminopeptidase
MARDVERTEHVRRALNRAGLEAIACALPANVLLLSGYWPVVGTALALAKWDGRTTVLAPEDEQALAAEGWADEVHTFQPGSLQDLRTAEDALAPALAVVADSLRIARGRIGYESGEMFQPASYAALHLYGSALPQLLGRAFPAAALVPADELLVRLRSTLTAAEQGRLRTACRAAAAAFEHGRGRLRAGLKETAAAALFRGPLSTQGTGDGAVLRADGFTFCMSGPNAARAHAVYAHSGDRELAAGDLVLVHCNSYVDGLWTDVTRTYCLGEPNERQRGLYEAVFAARSAALAAIVPGVHGTEVDRAARGVLAARSFGPLFKHSTGHGVGFAAIDHNAQPRLHPKSDDVLRPGMVCNVEPALYLDGYGGLRHCDVVLVTPSGPEVLTPFQASLEELVLA